MKTVTAGEFTKIHSGYQGITIKQFTELHDFALTEKGSKVLTAGYKSVKTRSHVGVIQTRSGMVLEILPKISRDKEANTETMRMDFIKMLRVMKNLPGFRDMNLTNLRITKMPLFEIFISMFLTEIQTIVKKGLKSSYVEREDNMNFLRGKLVAGEHIRRNHIHRERFYVRYDEYIQDIPKNRILKTALIYLDRVSKTSANRQKIRELMFVFDEVKPALNPENEYGKITHDRTTDYYTRALTWAMLFLRGKSFATYSGSSIAFALLFPMEKVFENYLYHCLKKHSPLTDVVSQSTKYSLAKENIRQLFQLRPDITAVGRDNTRYIIDAKWKLLDQTDKDSKYGISQTDMYQLFSYAKIYQAQENTQTKLCLIFPKTEMFSETKTMHFNDNQGANGTEIKILPFDLSGSLNFINTETEFWREQFECLGGGGAWEE